MTEPQNFRRWKSFAVLACALLLSSCGTEPKEPGVCADGSDWRETVVLTVDTDGIPVFNWSPTCRARSLQITYFPDGGEPVVVWRITTAERQALLPGIRYGVVPARASATVPASPLVTGGLYMSELAWYIGSEENGRFAHKSFFGPIAGSTSRRAVR